MDEDHKILLTLYIMSCMILGIIFIINIYKWYKRKNDPNDYYYSQNLYEYLFDEDKIFRCVLNMIFVLFYLGYFLYYIYEIIYNLL